MKGTTLKYLTCLLLLTMRMHQVRTNYTHSQVYKSPVGSPRFAHFTGTYNGKRSYLLIGKNYMTFRAHQPGTGGLGTSMQAGALNVGPATSFFKEGVLLMENTDQVGKLIMVHENKHIQQYDWNANVF